MNEILDENKIFSERLSKLINDYKKETGFSNAKIAEQLGFEAKSTITKYMKCRFANIGPTKISKLAKFFHVSPSWLAGYTDDKYYNVKEK